MSIVHSISQIEYDGVIGVDNKYIIGGFVLEDVKEIGIHRFVDNALELMTGKAAL